jgi:valyl-tRNA synthetase
MGWPEKTDALEEFYPGNVLVTGFDIIFFWVARMIMFGLKFMGDVPFREVYIHGLIRDQDNQKMSKSKGNVLDPIDLIDGIELEDLVDKRTKGMMQEHLAPKIEKATRKHFPNGIDQFGTDALRLTFAALATTGRDIRFDLGRIEGYKNFCNKLWNAARYVLMNTESLDEGEVEFSSADRWIRSRLNTTTADMHQHLTSYRLDLALQSAYEFTWHDFCDWYLELSKPILQSGESSDAEKRGTRQTLIEVLETTLRLLHPLMPFVTEEIWQTVAPRANIEGETIMLRPYPEVLSEATDADAVADIEWVQQFILGIRQIRGEMDISPGKPLPIVLQDASASDLSRAKSQALLLQRVGRVESVTTLIKDEDPPAAATALLGDMRMLVPMKGLIDVDAERARLTKQQGKINNDLQRSVGKLKNEKFATNAPAEVVTQEQERVVEFEKAIAQLTEQLEKLDELA